jgi:hypothetical protein
MRSLAVAALVLAAVLPALVLLAALMLAALLTFALLPHAGLRLLAVLLRLVVVQLHRLARLVIVLAAATGHRLVGLRLLLFLLTIELLVRPHD